MYYIGIDLGGTKILGALFNEEGDIVKKSKIKTRAAEGKEHVFSQITKVIDELVDEIDIKEVKAIGAGVPGIIDGKNGIVVFTPNLPWENYELTKEVTEKYGIPMYIGNDVNVGIMGERMYGAAKGLENVIGIFVGTGIGGGIIIEGKLYEGKTGAAGEIGHITIDPKGPICGCGARGCLEAIASKTAILKYIKAQLLRGRKSTLSEDINEESTILKSGHLKKSYENNDELSLEVIEKMCEDIGIGTSSLMNILNPEAIVFGGGIIESLGEILLPKIKKTARQYAMPKIFENCEFKIAELGDDAGIMGALALAQVGNEL